MQIYALSIFMEWFKLQCESPVEKTVFSVKFKSVPV